MKIIGGKFGLPRKVCFSCASPTFLEGDPILLSNARSAIKLVVDSLQPKNIYLPSYLCPSIISALTDYYSIITFYPIGKDLRLENYEIIDQIEPGELFFFIDYFGFPFDRELIDELHQKEVLLLQDCCQALFADWENSQADFIIYSPRKFLGVPDGGILYVKNPSKLISIQLTKLPDEILLPLFFAVVLRREFDLFGGDRKWNDFFHFGEVQLTPSNYQMSEISAMLLKSAFDYQKVKTRRRENFLALAEKLEELALFPDLLSSNIPLGFPVLIHDRDKIQKALFRKNIYPPIHWKIAKDVPHEFIESHELSGSIMTLPCDQRYTREDMDYMADSLLNLL